MNLSHSENFRTWLKKWAALRANDIYFNYSPSLLHTLAEDYSQNNQSGNLCFQSNITARSAKQSVFEILHLDLLQKLIENENLILLTLQIGNTTDQQQNLRATVLISTKYPHLPLMLMNNFWNITLESSTEIAEWIQNSDIISIDLPNVKTPENRTVHIDTHSRITLIQGIDYYGELKMSLLRMAMEIYRKDRGGLGVHAGSKEFYFQNGARGGLIFGLSGTGKTTLTCYLHTQTLKENEKLAVLQDDINLISEDIELFGSERGFYVKCDSCPEHKEITQAVLNKGSILENVAVNSSTHQLEWKNFQHTRNSRAIIDRQQIPGTTDYVDLRAPFNFIVYNTRRPDLPPISKCTNPFQIAAYYALGESIITSAEDASRVGEAKRQIGFDPFICEEPHLNIHRIKNFMLKSCTRRGKTFDCFIVNTGYIGEESNDITVEMTTTYLEAALRNELDWELDENLKLLVPKQRLFPNFPSPEDYYGKEKYKHIIEQLRLERHKYLSEIPRLDTSILFAI